MTVAMAGSSAAANPDPEVDLPKAELAVQAQHAILARHAAATAEVEKAKNSLSWLLQRLGNQRSFTGDADGAMEAFDQQHLILRRPARTFADDLDRLAAASADDALEAIVREARKHRVVILNEAHHVPLHRAFAMRLARELRKIGYTWLAAETFEKTVFGKGYLALSDGYYSREPVFGNFLRDAAGDGWKMVQYEPFDQVEGETFAQQTERRETGQARNLVERVLAKDPSAKVFIFVGYGHAAEMPRVGNGTGTAMMAAQLKHMTGLDPLTIDQVAMIAHIKPEAEHAMYVKTVEREHRKTPFVLRSPSGGYEVFGGYRYEVDMQVVHPRYGRDGATGRPAWMGTLAGFKPVSVPADLLPLEGTHLLYAHLKGQPADSVPADIVRLEAGKPAPQFMLPPGEYSYSIRK
ncbi:hypothetical protein ASD15_23855 [Massilia sp. Root351]|nr:hypothetical protein ASD15_23855 [Massilia sp. Root351]